MVLILYTSPSPSFPCRLIDAVVGWQSHFSFSLFKIFLFHHPLFNQPHYMILFNSTQCRPPLLYYPEFRKYSLNPGSPHLIGSTSTHERQTDRLPMPRIPLTATHPLAVAGAAFMATLSPVDSRPRFSNGIQIFLYVEFVDPRVFGIGVLATPGSHIEEGLGGVSMSYCLR